MPTISVIVPIYKVEPYIRRCIDSILAQTYTDFELILVDDGSPDNCGAICDEYATKDSRIHVIHQENGGVSAARNAGIDIASGEYLTFVDSDDWVKTYFLERLLSTPADLLCQTKVTSDEFGEQFFYDRNTSKTYCPCTRSEIADLVISGRLNWIASKRYKLSIIQEHEIRFNTKIDFGEDTLFTVEVALHSSSVVVENVSNYVYVNYSSRRTLGNTYSDNRILALRKANYIISQKIGEGNEKLIAYVFSQRMLELYQYYFSINGIQSIDMIEPEWIKKDFLELFGKNKCKISIEKYYELWKVRYPLCTLARPIISGWTIAKRIIKKLQNHKDQQGAF